jgi:hypothetical protein
VPDDARATGGGGGGPPDDEARVTGAIGIAGAGRIETGCEDVRPGGGGGTSGGGAGNAELPGIIPAGGVGQPVRVERPTGATSAAPEIAGGGGGTNGFAGAPSGAASASELSAPGGRDQPLPFTRSSNTCKSSPPLPSDIEATPCSSCAEHLQLPGEARSYISKSGPNWTVVLQLSKNGSNSQWPDRPAVGRNNAKRTM